MTTNIFPQTWTRIAGIQMAALAVICTQGCATPMMMDVNYAPKPMVPYRARPVYIYGPGAVMHPQVFPYGAAVRCPQVLLGNGMARCQ